MSYKEAPERMSIVEREISVPEEKILRHVLRRKEAFSVSSRFHLISANAETPLIFTLPFYHANIGSFEDPLILELRFVKTDHGFWIALLMTNERYPRDLEIIAAQIRNRVQVKEMEFDAVAAPASLGSFIAQEIARQKGSMTPVMTLQKGKTMVGLEKEVRFQIVPPKPWIKEKSGITVGSRTSARGVQQKLYIDQDIAKGIQDLRFLLVDDARLTPEEGTLSRSLILSRQVGLNIVAAATVLNEADNVAEVNDIPYVFLTKIPLFDRVEGGLQPRAGTYEGLEYFYIEI